MVALLASVGMIQAQTLLLDEKFEYDVTSSAALNGKGAWTLWGTDSEDPIQISATRLTDKYGGQTEGLAAVELTNTASGEDLYYTYATENFTEGSVYYAAVLRVTAAPEASETYFLCMPYVASKFSKPEVARLFAKQSSDGKYKLGVSRSGEGNGKVAYTTQELAYGEDVLVVVRYTIVEGTTNDEVALYVNPAPAAQQPAQADAVNINIGSDANLAKGALKAIELRQGQTKSKNAPSVLVAGLRVATSYGALFGIDGPVVPDTPKPIVSTTPSSLVFGNYGYVYPGEVYTQDVVVKAENLTGDITVGGMTTGLLTASATTIDKDAAMSDAGYTLTVTLRPTAASVETRQDVLTLSTEGLETPLSLTAMWTTIVPDDKADLTALLTSLEEGLTYRVTGDLTVTHVQPLSGKTQYFLQDDARGLLVEDTEGLWAEAGLKAGMKVKNLLGKGVLSFGTKYLRPVLCQKPFEAVSEGNAVQPVKVGIADLLANPAIYQNRLVCLEGVELGWKGTEGFAPVQSGDTFTADAGNRTQVRDAAGKQVEIRVFDASMDFVGQPIPAKANLTGLSTASTGKLIAPRSMADIAAIVAKPELQVTPLTILFNETGTVFTNQEYTLTLTLTGKNLQGEVKVSTNSPYIMATPATLTKEQVEAEGGAKVTLLLDAGPVPQPDMMTAQISIRTQGLDDITLSTFWQVLAGMTEINTLAELATLDYTNREKCIYRGEAVVTHVQPAYPAAWVYLQDATCGICFSNYDYTIRAGEKLTDLVLEGQIDRSLFSVWGNAPTVVATGQTVVPDEVTIEELAAEPARYENRVICLKNVELGWMNNEVFAPVELGETFAADGPQLWLRNQTGAMVEVKYFAGADYLGRKLPATANVTGLAVSKEGTQIAPRTTDDIESLSEPIAIQSLQAGMSLTAGQGTIVLSGAADCRLTVYDVAGNQVADVDGCEVKGLAPALYLVRIDTADGRVVKKVMVK